jgi:hypothetical protein
MRRLSTLKKSNKKIFLLILVAILGLIPFYQASAQSSIINNIGSAVIFATVGWAFAIIRWILAAVLEFLGSSIDTVLSIPVGQSPVVANVWELVRDFCNMFFIVILIVMAFSTIFSVSRYDFRTLIAKFLIAALLINFSLVIGNLIIDWTQSLSNVFTEAIGSIGNRLGQIYILGNRFAPPTGNITGTQALELSTWQLIIAAFGDIILLFIACISMLALFTAVIVRVPILWALLIFSPVAWITYILPSTSHINKQWWKYFIGWNVFLPTYLFFVYIGLYIADPARRTQLLGTAPNAPTALGFGLEDMFFYILIALILIWGAKFAMSSAMGTGAGAVASWGWAKGWATSRYVGSRVPLPVPTGRQFWKRDSWTMADSRAISGAAEQRMAQFKKEGIFGIGGTERAAGAQSGMAQAFGVRGASQQQIQTNISLSEDKMRKARTSQAELEKILSTGTTEQKIAAANIIKGQYRALRGDEVKGLYEEYKRISPAEAAKWIRSQKDSIEILGKTDLDELEATADPQMKQFIARIKAKRDLIPDVDEWENKLKFFTAANGGNDATMASFVGESKEFLERLHVDNAVKLLESDALKGNKESTKKLATIIAKKGIETKKLLELTAKDGTFESLSEIERFLDVAKEGNLDGALEAKLKAGVLRDLINKEVLAADPKDTAKIEELITKVSEQEYDKMTPRTIAAQPLRTNDDPNKRMGLAIERQKRALQRSLEKSKPNRFEDFYRSDEYTSNIPVKNIVDPMMKDIISRAVKRDLVDPLEASAQQVIDLAPQIKSAKDGNDKSLASRLIATAEISLSRAKKINNRIELSKNADDATKDLADKKVVEAEIQLNGAKNYKK